MHKNKFDVLNLIMENKPSHEPSNSFLITIGMQTMKNKHICIFWKRRLTFS